MVKLYLFIVFGFIAPSFAKRFDFIRDYLDKHSDRPDVMSRIYSPTDTLWLQNSNIIGFGYNMVYGSPVCYTGQCQSTGFKQPVFKLVYSKPVQGSCTTKQIPDHVELHCIPNSDLTTTTETISTLKQLFESTSKGWGLGVNGIKYKMFSAGYDYSSETHFMIDQLLKHNRTALRTTAIITYGKLSMFEPRMELSDNFRYIIDQLDDVNLSEEDLDDFIEIFVNYFGITFVSELLLGGLASETLFKQTKEMNEQQVNGRESSHSPSINFFLTFNGKYSSTYNKTEYNQFMSTVEMSRTTKLGGDPSVHTLNEWIKTVPSNPAVVNFAIKDIVSLLTPKRFRTDPLIQNKSQLIVRGIDRYLSQHKPTCYNNCTSSTHGQCDLTESPYFLLATCKCVAPWWTGVDCSKRGTPIPECPTIPKNNGVLYYTSMEKVAFHPDGRFWSHAYPNVIKPSNEVPQSLPPQSSAYACHSYSWIATGTRARFRFFVAHHPHSFILDDITVYHGMNQLIKNSGFETGNFDGWTFTPGRCSWDWETHAKAFCDPNKAHTGRCYTQGHCSNDVDTFEQIFPTVRGDTYVIGFFIRNWHCCGNQDLAWFDISEV